MFEANIHMTIYFTNNLAVEIPIEFLGIFQLDNNLKRLLI